MRDRLALCVLVSALLAACGGNPSSPSPCCAASGPLTLTFTPQDSTFAAATAEYRQIWADEGARIIAAMERVSRLTFTDGRVEVIVFEGVSNSGTGGAPMYLRASYTADVKKATMVHELGHRLAAGLTTLPAGVDGHRVLNRFLYDVWDDLWGRAFADEQVVVESSRRGVYDYETAWQWALTYDREGRARRLGEIVASNRR